MNDSGGSCAHRPGGSGDLTDFVISNLTVASRRVLGDRTDFVLDAEARDAWVEINRRRARSLTGLRELMGRPSPFTDE